MTLPGSGAETRGRKDLSVPSAISSSGVGGLLFAGPSREQLCKRNRVGTSYESRAFLEPGLTHASSTGLFSNPKARKISHRAARTSRIAEIGRVKKITGLPLEMIRERRKANSKF
jgi:hypothetical protein